MYLKLWCFSRARISIAFTYYLLYSCLSPPVVSSELGFRALCAVLCVFLLYVLVISVGAVCIYTTRITKKKHAQNTNNRLIANLCVVSLWTCINSVFAVSTTTKLSECQTKRQTDRPTRSENRTMKITMNIGVACEKIVAQNKWRSDSGTQPNQSRPTNHQHIAHECWS